MKKYLALTLALTLLLGLLSGCGGTSNETVSSSPAATISEDAAETGSPETSVPSEPASEASADASAAETPPEETADTESASLDYPLVTDGSETITVWVSLPPHVSPYMENVSDSAAYRAAAEATGIQMVTTTVSTAVQEEQFQLMCAAQTTGDYDVIIGGVDAYGSADAALADEIFLDVSPYTAELMPDFQALLDSDEEIRKLLTTDSGAIVNIAGRGTGGRAQGFGIRKDWLDAVGLEIPTTYDALYEVLTAFKTEFNCSEPLLMYSTGFLDNDFLCSGLGMTQNGYYVENGVVHFAYLESSFQEYCQMLSKWYAEGLFSQDFINNTQGAGISYDAQMLDGTAGVFMTGVDIFSSSSKASAESEDWQAVPMADVTRTGTETITLGNTPNTDPLSNKWNVTTGVAEDRLANVLGFINWFFTEDGSIACNFGIEGEGFTYVDGEPRLTELVTNNPDGLQSFMSEAIYLNWNAPFCLDERYYDSVYDTQEQSEASEIWNSNRDNSQQYHGDMNSEESYEYNAIYNDIDTYIDTMSISFITGVIDVNEQWDTFVETLYDMGIEDCIAIKQAAYDRYAER